MEKLYFIKEALFKILGNRVDFLREKFVKEESAKGYYKTLEHYPTVDKDILKKNQIELAEKIFNNLVEADPTKNKQYLQWLIKQYKLNTDSRFIEDLGKVTTRLEIFHDLGVHKKLEGKNKDINKYTLYSSADQEVEYQNYKKGMVGSLWEVTEPYMKSKSDLTKDEQKIIEEEAEKIWDGEEWVVYIPKTELSACVLGKDTDWCTTYGYEGGRYPTRTGNMFEYYNRTDDLYILINKNTGEKYQFHFASSQYMYSDDSPVDLFNFIDDNPEIEEAFYKRLPELKRSIIKGLITRAKSDEFGTIADKEVEDIYYSHSEMLERRIKEKYESYAEKNSIDLQKLTELFNKLGVTKQLEDIEVPDAIEINLSNIHNFINKCIKQINNAKNLQEVINVLNEAPTKDSEYWYESDLYNVITDSAYNAYTEGLDRVLNKIFNNIVRNNKQYIRREQQGQTNLFAIRAMLEELLK